MFNKVLGIFECSGKHVDAWSGGVNKEAHASGRVLNFHGNRIRTCTALARGRVSNSHKQMRGNLDVHKAAQAVVIVQGS